MLSTQNPICCCECWLARTWHPKFSFIFQTEESSFLLHKLADIVAWNIPKPSWTKMILIWGQTDTGKVSLWDLTDLPLPSPITIKFGGSCWSWLKASCLIYKTKLPFKTHCKSSWRLKDNEREQIHLDIRVLRVLYSSHEIVTLFCSSWAEPPSQRFEFQSVEFGSVWKVIDPLFADTFSAGNAEQITLWGRCALAQFLWRGISKEIEHFSLCVSCQVTRTT